MKGAAELRRRAERLDDVNLDRALEAAMAGRFAIAEKILAAVPAKRKARRRERDELLEEAS